MATALRRAQTHLSLQVLILVTILLPAFTCPGIVTNEVNVDCEDDTKMAGSKIRPTTPVIEYFKEHEVSEKESRLALEALDLDQLTKVPAWCDECGIDKIHFCRSAAFINDHCCCEHRHARANSLPSFRKMLYAVAFSAYTPEHSHHWLGGCSWEFVSGTRLI
ncbi:uncharacterized protein LOC131677799 isoform X2 [Topomyia yanbarensis]|uniref:uncharacterized protein LOC131677799 isoform X2 n=1 Tax=Topomyia yanbarensis TaxID=2498891 RepID=UPI00273B8F55|nr:uncharacterized protein LOC131677799 isoform X2 [Topomyia yanbarensis]